MNHQLFQELHPKERRGSKPRCHLLTHGPAAEVAARLSELAAPFAQVSPDDRWMPQGFVDTEEAQLHKALRLLNSDHCAQLRRWWLAPASVRAKSPNFDIASTCEIEGKPGLLLVEAKAHDEELIKESLGRRLTSDASGGVHKTEAEEAMLKDRLTSHETIGSAIAEACNGLAKATGLPWQLSRDSHYQMSNRFAWAWKLAELGVPVVLIYLGFLHADEMADRGKPIADHSDWQRLVLSHSAPLFPAEAWGRRWLVNAQPFVALIRSLFVPLGLVGKGV